MTTVVAPASAVSPRDRLRLTSAAVDTLMCAALGVVAGIGFHTSFGGWRFLPPVVAAACCGSLLALFADRLRWWGILTTAVAAVLFVVVGGLMITRDLTVAGVPTPASFASLVQGGTSGWPRLLTVIPPAGKEGNLLVVPFETIFVATLLSAVLALRRRALAVPIVPLAIAFVLAVLWGTSHPAALLVQGCGFGLGAAVWLAARAARGRRLVGGSSQLFRRAAALGMIVFAAVVAGTAGARLPFVGQERFVLREKVEPPLDPAAFPSPLTRWPYYSHVRKNDVLFRIDAPQALPPGTVLRLAAMDSYDGGVFAVHVQGRGPSSTFVKASSELPDPPPGERVELTVTARGLRDVWLPVLGDPVVVEPVGATDRSVALGEALRFNRATRALILPNGLRDGDAYTLATVLDAPVSSKDAPDKPIDAGRLGPPLPAETPEWLRALGQRIVDSKGANSPLAKARALEAALFADGSVPVNPPLAGTHSIYRLELFLEKYRQDPTAVLRGTEEQYVATMAILARMFDLPSRVVVGFKTPDGQTAFDVKGADVTTWVEIAFEDVGWVRFNPVPNVADKPDTTRQAPPKGSKTLPPEPPPPAVPPPPRIVPADESVARRKRGGLNLSIHLNTPAKVGLWLLSIPAGAAASSAVLGGVKQRRRRRRSTGGPEDRVDGAWAELVDRAKDRGRPVPALATRHEAGLLVGGEAAPALADRTDALLFGGHPVSDEAATELWAQVDAATAEMETGRTRFQRWQARANPQSLLEGRRRRRLVRR